MRRGKFSTLQIALFISAGLHAGLLAFRWVDPENFNRLFEETPLEVVLVNSRSTEAPTKAMALAQANLAGGGQAETGRATSPLPPSKLLEVGEANEVQHAQIAELQQQQQQLLARVRRELALLPLPDQERDRGTAEAREQAERRRQLVQLLAEIERRVNEENARPRKRYVSPATREVVYAQYYDSLRRKVEARGTRDFPTYKGRKLYGELTMNIHVDHRGRVIETDIVASSGNNNLDRRAVAIVRAASPFGNFSQAMRKGAEVLVITSRFRFTREDGLETSLSPQP
ncbi:cell envelope integrity protein TolA [Paucibacter sp. B51]|jgi:protein TonB|uniref:cell envelope integrity protein TolA n=1 Tax=Paucibacter sp. B51 TaxID=2993315 RepID=UPI000BDB1745|nr:cell envelope integrity protein TolA [Paucibacter sp. B51]MCZ8076318.1 cell envelope integrity protein TolA [Roseateles sp.]OYU25593.1 MAG: energy transducer TonB [Burkholderiales bacterium PBB2]